MLSLLSACKLVCIENLYRVWIDCLLKDGAKKFQYGSFSHIWDWDACILYISAKIGIWNQKYIVQSNGVDVLLIIVLLTDHY